MYVFCVSLHSVLRVFSHARFVAVLIASSFRTGRKRRSSRMSNTSNMLLCSALPAAVMNNRQVLRGMTNERASEIGRDLFVLPNAP